MMRFSQREGIVPIRVGIQKDSMEPVLRNGLWNALDIFYWIRLPGGDFLSIPNHAGSSRQDTINLFFHLWVNHFNRLLDDLPGNWRTSEFDTTSKYQEIKDYFFECKWYEVYDFIEFVANNYTDTEYGNKHINASFTKYCNSILECESSAYRFVDRVITQITTEEEIKSIEEVLELSDTFAPVAYHLRCALKLFSDRSNPDYRNAIKESISAVEAMCKLVVRDDRATLGQAIRKVGGIHPALQIGFEKIYGYSNDSKGIRHALLTEGRLKSEDAKFMVVACSAFVNYIKVKQVM